MTTKQRQGKVTGHTAGPWKHDGNLVETVDGNFQIAQTIDQNREANASLIASAPELLEACKDALELVKAECDAHDKGDLSRGDFSLLEQLEKVIAKVEGRDNA